MKLDKLEKQKKSENSPKNKGNYSEEMTPAISSSLVLKMKTDTKMVCYNLCSSINSCSINSYVNKSYHSQFQLLYHSILECYCTIHS